LIKFIIHFLITITSCLLVGFVHRTTMNAYLHSVRKSLKASMQTNNDMRLAASWVVRRPPSHWASVKVLSVVKSSVFAWKIDLVAYIISFYYYLL